MKKWSGDHCSFDYTITSGVFLSNKKISKTNPHIADIAPTVFKTLGVENLPNLDGKPLF
jgi:bisphosphoglycerate-independent phosphoglycerate mutase (AlkP superfamily)